MRAYVLFTASVFAILAVLHIVRLFAEGGHPFATDPWFVWGNVAGIAFCAGLVAWAVTLLRRRASSNTTGN